MSYQRNNADSIRKIYEIILQSGFQSYAKDDFISSIQTKIHSELEKSIPRTTILRYILTLRLTGLLQRKYYHISPLGLFLLKNQFKIDIFVEQIFQEVPEVLTRSQSSIITYKQFSGLYIACGKWYLKEMIEKGYSAPDDQSFLAILQHSFEWEGELPEELNRKVDQVLEEKKRTTLRHLLASDENPFLPDKLNLKKIEIPVIHSKKVIRGKVIKKALEDIYNWLTSIDIKTELDNNLYDIPYFDVRSYAKKAKRGNLSLKQEPIKISNYIRTVTWLMNIKFRRSKNHNTGSSRQRLAYLSKLHYSDDLEKRLLENYFFIRRNLEIHFLRINQGRKKLVLVFKSNMKDFPPSLHHLTKNLFRECGSCKYFEKKKKKDCLFFRRLEYFSILGKYSPSDEIDTLFRERIEPIFTNKVACRFWRPLKSYQVSLFHYNSNNASCVYCLRLLPELPTPNSRITCICKSIYSFISRKKANQGIYLYSLSTNHSIGCDFALIDPYLFKLVESSLPKNAEHLLGSYTIFDPLRDSEYLECLVNNTQEHLRILEEDKIKYLDKQNLIQINNKPHINLNKIDLIDTDQWDEDFLIMVEKNSHLKINHRTWNINLSQDEKASIVYDQNEIPSLQVKHLKKRPTKHFPLYQISTVYNRGKPRLNEVLKLWGVKIIYESTKGIRSQPDLEVSKAIELPGVRETFRKLHLQGLAKSIQNATFYLIEIAHRNQQEEIARHLAYRFQKLNRKKEQFFIEEALGHLSFQQAGLKEAWWSRPFAEGIRQVVKKVQNQFNPIILRNYGRNVAKWVNKNDKQGKDYMGAYTPFDTALNCIHRNLRYRLMKENAKLGMGFKTIPLFVHTAPDKKGRAGHLDLEEVSRLITRLVLVKLILKGEISDSQFEMRYDDEFIPYYTPTMQTIIKLRRLVKEEVFLTRVLYEGRWRSLLDAHKRHVRHLCYCLHQCHKMDDEVERMKYLEQFYQPLVLHFSQKTHLLPILKPIRTS